MSFLSIETRWRHRCRGRMVLPIGGASRNRDRQIYRAFAGHDTTWAECRCAAALAPRSSVCPHIDSLDPRLRYAARQDSHFELFRVGLGVDHVACLRPAIRGPARCRILRDHRNLHAYPVMACAIRCRDPADVEPRNGTMEERDHE